MSLRKAYNTPDELYNAYILVSNLQDDISARAEREDDPCNVDCLNEDVHNLSTLLGFMWEEYTAWKKDISPVR